MLSRSSTISQSGLEALQSIVITGAKLWAAVTGSITQHGGPHGIKLSVSPSIRRHRSSSLW
ncbi:hypothetical protein FOPG_19984 [Fusarium oxysporum f. sp. conglutinans race 2 54008]|uniref:Uncharacterized protein n=1 Tax=Fusarium oxysporum f. sp. conglutinans race 2 54008 TaxID=1089457 RepID=X0GKA2_FUSOX|nr:hypothetical protein FOPG_19984 [Fusarium oxysporum f. sp. conglutinans race 2 54008]